MFVACSTHETVFVTDPGALGPYSAAVQMGDLALISGKLGERGGSFEHEVQTCLDAVEQILVGMDMSLADVIETRVYLTDIEQYAAFNAIYAQRMTAPYPTRTCVAVAALPGGARVEVQVAARR